MLDRGETPSISLKSDTRMSTRSTTVQDELEPEEMIKGIQVGKKEVLM